jgi:hypothetical protein
LFLICSEIDVGEPAAGGVFLWWSSHCQVDWRATSQV